MKILGKELINNGISVIPRIPVFKDMAPHLQSQHRGGRQGRLLGVLASQPRLPEL